MAISNNVGVKRMKILCPTCGGRKTINDPTIMGSMSYSGPNGENWPQVPCQTCGGSGWVYDDVDHNTKKRTNTAEE